MNCVLQSYKTGELKVVATPPPQLRPGHALVRTVCSVISAGTEKTKVDTARKSLLGKALARPDLVKQVIAKARKEGLWKTWQVVSDKLDTPTPLGYSSAGQIVEVCGDVDGLRPGDWVACAGSTANHAELVCVPKNLLARIPNGVAPESAAFATLGAIALQGVRQAEVRLGEKVAVIGLGLIGLLTVQILRAAGCRVLGVDVDSSKVALAHEFGCSVALLAADESLAEHVLAFTDGYGVDATLITAGTSSNEPIECAGEITREKGRVVVVGAAKMDVPREPYYLKEIDLRISRSYGPGRYDPSYEVAGHDYPYGYVRFTERRNLVAFLELLESGSVSLAKIITHRFPLNQAAQAYALISGERKQPYLGIVLEYSRPLEQIPRRIELRPAPVSKDRFVVGVIGAGSYASKYLLPALRSHPRLSPGSVCTGSGMTAENIARKFGFTAAEADAGAVIKSSDAVIIATRHADHAALAVQALQLGKPVFVEKPLAITPEQLDEVEQTLNSHHSLTVGFNRRFAPATRMVRDHFQSVRGPKQILIRVNAGAIAKDHWIHDPQVGGGRLIGEGCHFVDLAVALTGSLVAAVQAVAVVQAGRSPELWDDFSLQLTLADQSIATIVYTAGGDTGLAKERIEISGGGRSAVIDDFSTVELWHEGRRTRKKWSTQDKGQDTQMNSWAESLRTGISSIPLAELINVHRACFAAIRSFRDRQPVQL